MHSHVRIFFYVGMELKSLYRLLAECNFKICIDTRKIQKGDVFFALRGPNYDANTFAMEALEKGAAAAVVDNDAIKNDRIYYVPDVLKTLQSLALHHRKNHRAIVIAITGSNGKTTTKELAYSIFSRQFNTLATEGNFNNHIGIPLTLFRMNSEHEFVLIEMGANHIGEIETYCKFSLPDAGLITSIGKAHLEGFGGLKGVIQAKTELFRFLQTYHYPRFYNLSDPILSELFLKDSSQQSFGLAGSGAACTVSITDHADGYTKGHFIGKSVSGSFTSPLTGTYNALNISAAVALADHYHVDAEHVSGGINSYCPTNLRSEQIEYKNNYIFLDVYNANPSSMEAALKNFITMRKGPKWIILGAMAELGEYSKKEHSDLVMNISPNDYETLILIGPEYSDLQNNQKVIWFEHTAQCLEWLQGNWPSQKSIFIKGSRSAKLEMLVGRTQ